MKLNFLFSFPSSLFGGPPSINNLQPYPTPPLFPQNLEEKKRGKTHPMLLLMHFRSHPITCHIIHSHRIPALISLSSTSPFVRSASTHPESNNPNITRRQRQKFVTHRSPPLQNAIKAISAPRTRKTGTHTYKKTPGQAGIGKKKKKKSGARCMK